MKELFPTFGHPTLVAAPSWPPPSWSRRRGRPTTGVPMRGVTTRVTPTTFFMVSLVGAALVAAPRCGRGPRGRPRRSHGVVAALAHNRPLIFQIFNKSSSARRARSKPKEPNISFIAARIRSLPKFPMLPKCVCGNISPLQSRPGL